MNSGKPCKKCGLEIGINDRFCAHCGADQSAGGASAATQPKGPGSDRRVRVEVLLPLAPKGIAVRFEGDELVVTRGWPHAGYIIGVIIAAVGMIWFAWIRWTDVHNPSWEGDVRSGLGLVIWPLALWFFYAMLAGSLNSTIITARPDRIKVAHRPLWWPGNRTKPAGDLIGFETAPRTIRGGLTGYSSVSNFVVAVKSGEGRSWWLGGTMHSPGLADFIGMAVGAYYGVPVKTWKDEIQRRGGARQK